MNYHIIGDKKVRIVTAQHCHNQGQPRREFKCHLCLIVGNSRTISGDLNLVSCCMLERIKLMSLSGGRI